MRFRILTTDHDTLHSPGGTALVCRITFSIKRLRQPPGITQNVYCSFYGRQTYNPAETSVSKLHITSRSFSFVDLPQPIIFLTRNTKLVSPPRRFYPVLHHIHYYISRLLQRSCKPASNFFRNNAPMLFLKYRSV